MKSLIEKQQQMLAAEQKRLEELEREEKEYNAAAELLEQHEREKVEIEMQKLKAAEKEFDEIDGTELDLADFGEQVELQNQEIAHRAKALKPEVPTPSPPIRFCSASQSLFAALLPGTPG